MNGETRRNLLSEEELRRLFDDLFPLGIAGPDVVSEIAGQGCLVDTLRRHGPTLVKKEEQIAKLVGRCLWDIFSDNHTVSTVDGRLADLGSWRAASAILAEYLSIDDSSSEDSEYALYMGTGLIASRTDLTPVYVLIFRRLSHLGADWKYYFPRLHVIDTSDSGGPFEEQRLPPTEAQAREEARNQPTPATVRAYRIVYGQYPYGWPPA